MSSDSRLAKSAGAAGAATLTSRLLGLAREQVLAAVFGAGNDMDAFIVAFRVPNLLRDLFAEGAMSAALVPTFTRYLAQRGKPDAWRLANILLNALIVVTGAIVAAGMIFAPQIVRFYAGDFAAIPGKLELTITMTRIVLPFLVLVAIAAAMMGMLNSLHRYFVPALSPATFNLVTIVGVVTLVPLMQRLGWPPIVAVAVCVVVGGLAQVGIQWPLLTAEGYRYRPIVNLREPGLRDVLLLMGPGTLGLAATQVNIFVNTLLATSQGTGAVSWLTYAFRVMYLPIGLFGVSIATAVLPVVSQHAALGDDDGIRETVARGMGLMLMFNIPATVGLLALATPIVQLLFERGRFLPGDTAPTAAALRLYALGLVGYSTARIVSPTFYALRQSRLPVVISVCTIAANVAISLALVQLIGFVGLALGTSIAALANGATLLILLRRRLGGINGVRLAISLFKVTTASSVMALATLGTERAVAAMVTGPGTAAQVVRLALSIGVGLSTLAVCARLMRIHEFDEAIALVTRRVSRTS